VIAINGISITNYFKQISGEINLRKTLASLIIQIKLALKQNKREKF
jgi:hypothetical protein